LSNYIKVAKIIDQIQKREKFDILVLNLEVSFFISLFLKQKVKLISVLHGDDIFNLKTPSILIYNDNILENSKFKNFTLNKTSNVLFR
jgi:hypothetical protein